MFFFGGGGGGGSLFYIIFKLAKRGGGGYPQALSEVVTLWGARAFIGLPSISTILTHIL